VMGNHYHLAIETPQANLVAGMTWLQGTFAARFTRLRGENGPRPGGREGLLGGVAERLSLANSAVRCTTGY
jgi:hypothetical protein